MIAKTALAVLSTENLLHNFNILQSLSGGKKVIAMVKANAYGHGLRSVAKRLDEKAFGFGVARIEEALALRKVGVKSPIILMEGVMCSEELVIAACNDFQVVFHSEYQLHWLERLALPNPLTVWLKVDTGMGRLGFSIEFVQQAYKILNENVYVKKPINLMSHMGYAEEVDHPLTISQQQYFKELIQSYNWGLKSLANTASILQLPQTYYDVIRPGLGLYGASPLPNFASHFNLKPVMTLQSKIIAIQHMKAGQSIGYGARYTCSHDMRIGIIAMGYGDGYPRTTQDGAPILVNSIRCKIAGKVAMDMSSIDLTNAPQTQVGDHVTLWGDGLPIEEFASFTAHSPYDLLCAVQMRVNFLWKG